MLYKMQCDKFISNGHVRPAIEFHKGLNVIEGQDNGKNSIGKSTFLMCIDFAFGGNDYTDKLKTIKKNVGDHRINFSFKFESGLHHFSRSTHDPKIVYKCDENYNIISSMSIDDYTATLKILYGIDNKFASFRDLTSRYFRIYNRGNIDETLPLRGFSNESPTESVNALFKIFNLYGKIKDAREANKQAADIKSTFKSAGDYKIIELVNKTQIEKNNEEIKELELKLEEIIQKSNNGVIDLDAEKSELISKIDGQLKELKRERSLQYNKLKVIDNDKELSKISVQSDFEELKRFFPNVDIKKLEDIENFHNDLSKIFKKEMTDLEKKTWNFINVYNERIDELERKKLEIGCTTKIPKFLMEQHTVISKRLDTLRDQNKKYTEFEELTKQAKDKKEKLESTLLIEGANLSKIINDKMKQLCDELFSDYEEPKLSISKTGTYSFETENDEGTGTNYKGLILFDLAVLSLTQVPAIAHDSVTVKNIDKNVTENIYDLYNTFDKQVFAVIDRTNTYDQRMQDIVDNHRVIFLSSDGNELFGRSWAKKKHIEDNEDNND